MIKVSYSFHSVLIDSGCIKKLRTLKVFIAVIRKIFSKNTKNLTIFEIFQSSLGR